MNRLKFWAKQSIKSKEARPIFKFLLSDFLKKQKLERTEICRPQLTNGKYSFQEVLKHKRSLSIPKMKLSILKSLIP